MSALLPFEQLKSQLVALGAEQRGELAAFLLDSLHGSEQPDPNFRHTLARRREELSSGKVPGISAADAFARLASVEA